MQLRMLLVLIAILALTATAIGCPAGDTTEGTGSETELTDEEDGTDIDEPSSDEDPTSLSNPMVPDIESVARGETIYRKTCITCHGASGLGDGSASTELEADPANLTSDLTQDQTDGEIFITITNGRPGTPMPAWKSGISPEDRWNLVNYIRTLTGEDEPEPSE